MVFMFGDQRKKGISRVFRAIPWESIQRESKQSATYFVGSSSAFVGVAALAEAGAEPGVEPGVEPEGIPTADDISLDIATKYGIR